MTVTFKDLKSRKNQLGQFMTPDSISQSIVDNSNYTGLIIEPSFGLGSFLNKLEKKYSNIIGVEYDRELFNHYKGTSQVFCESFYQFKIPNTMFTSLTFTGNPPYRTPAYSLTTEDRNHVRMLSKKYKLSGIKEEAVFFIAHAVDLILSAGVPGEIDWILPKTIFENTSKAFTCFRTFLSHYAPLVELEDIVGNYPDVSQSLCRARFKVNQAVDKDISGDFKINDSITWQNIFKKTYLGTIPCEGLLMSCRGESQEEFRERMLDIFWHNVPLQKGLLYKGRYHLRSLNGKNANEKFKILAAYRDEISSMIDVGEFANDGNYKSISHRTEQRYYFRHQDLTKVSFIYILNSNPGASFFFPGNPSKSSTDYFGYCDYDCNRNSSPGANRCVRLDNIRSNIEEDFVKYWQANTNEPIEEIFSYILHVSKSSWYKNYKSKYQRFYFGLPLEFDTSWKKEVVAKLLPLV